MGRKRRNNVYRHYMLHEDTQTSTCLLCFKTLNSNHGSNLMHHLRFMHNIEYQQTLALNNGAILPIASPTRTAALSNDEDSAPSDGAGVVLDVDKFFTLDKGTTRARCDVCKATVERKYMMAHLKREHPKMLKPATEESDADDIDDNLYQEVVYLYDSDSKSTKGSKPMKLTTSTPRDTLQRAKRSRDTNRGSSRNEVNRKRKRRSTVESANSPVEESSEELENFGKYVTCLMKTVPKDLSTQLQMEIINLIMTAKIKNMAKPSTSAPPMLKEKLENVSVADSCNYDQSVMLAVEEGKCENSAIPSPESNTLLTKTE